MAGARYAARPELAALTDRLHAGASIALTAPRGAGKTSLLARLERTDPSGVLVDVVGCRDLSAFAARLATAVFALPAGRWHRARDPVGAFARSFSTPPTPASAEPTFVWPAHVPDPDVLAALETIFELLAGLPRRSPAVVVFDDFPTVASLHRALPHTLSALVAGHPSVRTVVAGGQHIADLVDRSRFETVLLEPLPDRTAVAFLRRRARAGSKSLNPPAATRLRELAGPLPAHLQRLAHSAFELAARSIEVGDVDAAFARVVDQQSSWYAERFAPLPGGQRRVLLELAADPTSAPYTGAFTRRVDLANPSSVSKALDGLVAAELVVRDGPRAALPDPFFAAWLARTCR